MGRYTSLWEELKTNKKLVLAVPPRLQKRIIKAVIRTKDTDIWFKLECAEAGYRYKIEYAQESARVTFTLKKQVSLALLLANLPSSTDLEKQL